MIKKILLSIVLCGSVSGLANAEDINTIFQNVNKFVTEKNYSKALQELTWAKKEIEKLHMTRLQEFLPAALAGYQGSPVEAGSAIGIMNISKKYSSGNNDVTLSLTGGSSGDAQAGFAGLAQLGAMAAAFGGATPGNETFRVAGRTATLTAQQGSNPEVTVILQSGAMLKLEAGNNTIDGATLKKMIEEIKIEDLDNYLKAN